MSEFNVMDPDLEDLIISAGLERAFTRALPDGQPTILEATKAVQSDLVNAERETRSVSPIAQASINADLNDRQTII